jgi:Tol biopolymer transport system component
MSIGIPTWSPRGDLIVFLRSHAFLPREDADPSDVIGRPAELWAICPDGTGLRRLVTGWAPCWSGDGNWLYYWSLGDSPRRVEKLPIDGGPAVVVREENERLILPAVSADGSTLYFVKPVRSSFFGLGRGTVNEVHRACPEHAPSEVLFSIPGERIPVEMRPGRIHLHIDVSPDGQWLATSLIDGGTTNLWALPTSGAQMKPLTDFGEQSVTIARSVSWSADSQYIYAAVAENDTDIVFIDGLIR